MRLLFVLLSTLALAAAGCDEPPTATPEPPDEPEEPEEPTPAPFEVDARSFSGTFTVGEPGEPGDDVTTAEVAGSYAITYWSNFEANAVQCRQVIEWSGVVSLGFGVLGADCAACSAVIDIPAESWEDISDPELDPDACDADELRAEQIETGRFLMTPVEADGGQSFQQIALVDTASALALGLEVTADGDPSLADLVTQFDDADLVLTHIGYIPTDEGALTGLAQVAGASGSDEPYGAMWLVSRDPALNPAEGMEPIGTHRLGSIWILQ